MRRTVFDAASFWRKADDGTYRVIALDEYLGWGRGSAICSKLRERGERRAILLVSHALSEVDGVALADQCGADAFVQKTPQAMRRAFERLAAIDPRRAAPLAKCEVRTAYRHAFTGARVEVLPRHVVLNEVTLDLSVLELAVFAHLLRRAPDIVTVPELQRDVWKSDAIARSAVSNVIGRLVDALPSDWIERVRGGYRARVG